MYIAIHINYLLDIALVTNRVRSRPQEKIHDLLMAFLSASIWCLQQYVKTQSAKESLVSPLLEIDMTGNRLSYIQEQTYESDDMTCVAQYCSDQRRR